MLLPSPPSIADGADTKDVVSWVSEHLGDLAREGRHAIAAGAIRGGQSAADKALALLDITGYAGTRSNVLPVSRRGASRLSPYIRHGLTPLPQVWAAVVSAPARDRGRYRDELLWQEYARHRYACELTARRGELSAHRGDVDQPPESPNRPREPRAIELEQWAQTPWPSDMNCMAAVLGELHADGWLVNQTRMWLASQWTVRAGADWRDGEDAMFAHLLDGSRAANRLGWQWTVGAGTGKAYGFSRWQVTKRAPELCRGCALASACPIEGWPDSDPKNASPGPDLVAAVTPAGPEAVTPVSKPEPELTASASQVWLTAESLGSQDPALAAVAGRGAVFVFDEPLLRRLQLSGKRLVFLAETLGELAQSRPLEVRRGDVSTELAGRSLAATWTPVPGWARIASAICPGELHPWPWLVRPANASLASFSAWRRDSRV